MGKFEMYINLAFGFAIFITIITGIEKICENSTGICYWVPQGTGNYIEGRTVCQSEGGDLAVIETVELWHFVKDNFK